MYVDDLEVIKTSNSNTIKYRSLTHIKQHQAGNNTEYEGTENPYEFNTLTVSVYDDSLALIKM